MCLWTKHKYGCVARKDIVAYKSVFIENPDNPSAWRGVVYSEKRFAFDTVLFGGGRVWKEHQEEWVEIEDGFFHAYTDRRDAETLTMFLNTKEPERAAVTVECVIPKGAVYYKEMMLPSNAVAASRIIVRRPA